MVPDTFLWYHLYSSFPFHEPEQPIRGDDLGMKTGCATGPAVMMAALRGWARWGGNSHDRVRSSEEFIPFSGSTAERFHDPLAIALPEPAFPLQEPVANTVPHCHRPEVVGTRRVP